MDGFGVCLEEERPELVASEPPRPVVYAKCSSKRRGDGPQDAVALLVALGVVQRLEVVEVEEDERELPAVATGPRGLLRDCRMEGPMVQEPRQRVAASSLGQLGGDSGHERHHRSVERGAGARVSAPLEHASEGERLGQHLVGGEAKPFALARVSVERTRGILARPCRLDDERKASNLAQAPQALQGGNGSPAERLFDRLSGNVPGRQSHAPRTSVRTESARIHAFRSRPGGSDGGWRCRESPVPHARRRSTHIQPRRFSHVADVVSMRELLEAGVHFGHQTRRWNPKMRRFLFTERGGIYIIDLQQTLALLEEAYAFVRNISERGGAVLFVGTKKQCQDAVADEARRVGMPFVNHRWLGGLLTNWRTISNRLERLEELRRQRDEGQLELLPPKERISLLGQLEKLETNLGGVHDMRDLPDAVFVIDLKKEQLAIREARRLGIPVVGLVDTNCDPDDADFIIPGNDDAISACSLVTRVIANAVADGRQGVSEAEMAQSNGRPPEEPVTQDEPADPIEEYGSETAALAEEALGEIADPVEDAPAEDAPAEETSQ